MGREGYYLTCFLETRKIENYKLPEEKRKKTTITTTGLTKKRKTNYTIYAILPSRMTTAGPRAKRFRPENFGRKAEVLVRF